MSDPTNGEAAAFPCPAGWGLTKRELFAAMLLASVASNADARGHWLDYAREAVDGADKLVRVLNETDPTR
jgi:hypothetical protein